MIDLACPHCHKVQRFTTGGFVTSCVFCRKPFSVPALESEESILDVPFADTENVFEEREIEEHPRRRRPEPVPNNLALAAASLLLAVASLGFAAFARSTPILFATPYAILGIVLGLASLGCALFAPKRPGWEASLCYIGLLLGSLTSLFSCVTANDINSRFTSIISRFLT